MKLSQFKFRLPDERIAQYPKEFEPGEERPYFHRDDCKLMVVHTKSGIIEHRQSFRDILDYFEEKDVFVFNDTKVFPARLYGNKEKTGAKIEVFLLRELNAEMRLWDVLVDPARKIRIGNKLYFGQDDGLVAEVIDNTTSRGRTLRFLYDGPHEEFKHMLFSLGEAPLPREIFTRPSEPEDLDDFQTVFAKREGAVTVPSAGLHFSPQLMKMMEIRGIEQAFVTLHYGLGCFRNIDVEDLTKHKTDSEEKQVTPQACEIINRAKTNKHRVVAVGTTVQRVLETAVSANGLVKPYDGWTNRFIFPPYDFRIADAMVANFYFPMSTLLMLTAAYGGYDLIMKAYKEAMRYNETDPTRRYRFGIFGDAMLILKD